MSALTHQLRFLAAILGFIGPTDMYPVAPQAAS